MTTKPKFRSLPALKRAIASGKVVQVLDGPFLPRMLDDVVPITLGSRICTVLMRDGFIKKVLA